MTIIKLFSLMHQYVYSIHQKGKNIALVPTMGNLHDGHIKLINAAKKQADVVVVSIFVNPMQFDRIDDLKRYRRPLKEDCKKLNRHSVDCIFAPSTFDVYPHGTKSSTYVEVPWISTVLEGAARPGHFRGVSTIVSKLFNLIQPNFAYFGEKDYQQLILVRKMVIDMGYNIEIISIPVVRAKDGLALSSRNCYLTAKQRKIAPNLNRIMNVIAENLISIKKLTLEEITTFAKQELNDKGFCAVDIQICNADTLGMVTQTTQRAVILVAAWLGQTRLIDSKIVKLI